MDMRGARPANSLTRPVCSSDVFYPLSDRSGFSCGHCPSWFVAPVEGCPLGTNGLHDENWMNDGRCACGADGAAEPVGVIDAE